MAMKKIFVYLAAITCSVAFSHKVEAQTWNSFSDFWVNVPATGGAGTYPQSSWIADGGSITPNAWNYAAGNLTGGANPTQVGTYLSGGSRYGLTAGNTFAGPGQSFTFGAGNYYIGYDMPVWPDIQVAKYNYIWDSTVPGWSGAASPNSSYLWLRPMFHNLAGTDSSAALLEWTAPSSGTFSFNALFAPGNFGVIGGTTVSYAAVDSLAGVLVPRQVVAQGSAVQTFTFTDTLTAGDVVQFQIGAPTVGASPVGVLVQVTAVPEPSTLALAFLGTTIGAIALRRKTAASQQTAFK